MGDKESPRDPTPSEIKPPTLVVALGASAGGLEPLQSFFHVAQAGAGLAYVVVQHLSPDFKSLMPELIQRHTTMAVVPITRNMPVAPNTVYVLAPGLMATLEAGELRTHPRRASAALEFPISTLFESLATIGRQGVAVVLSGTGSDGTVGAQRVHAAGGLVIAQDPTTARFESMPRSVIDSGCVDIVATVEEIPKAIAGWIADPVQGRHFSSPRARPSPASGEYSAILAVLNATYNIDFQNYKPGTIVRRIERRLTTGQVKVSASDYAERLATDRDELDRLFGDLLVGVTRFFRDEEMYLQLQTTALDEMVDQLSDEDELRLWSCGCSTGEEAYSLAMLASEVFSRRRKPRRLRVLATDLHGAALQQASTGVYSPEVIRAVPEELRQRYFVEQPSGLFKVNDELRRCVIFSAHNVLHDAAFTRIDVIACRNMLIYFQPQAQRRALAAFHFALRAGGVLFLGESEGVNELPDGFEPVSREAHVFRKRAGSRLDPELRGPMLTRNAGRSLSAAPMDLRAGKRLDDLIMQRYLPDCLLVNARAELLHVYGQAQRYLQPTAGRFAGELMGLLRVPLRTAIMLALRKSAQSGESVALPDISDEALPGERLSITVDPLLDRTLPQQHYMVRIESQVVSRPAGVSPALLDMQTQVTLQAAHEAELEAELSRMREALQSTIEELESANEELQAGNEELMASNEELQSTNEELHAVNEELYSVNSEHENKVNELRQTSADLNNLIRATELAILFLDSSLRLRMFTPEAAELFPIQPHDIGRPLLDFMPRESDGLLTDDLRTSAAQVAKQVPLNTADREFELSDGRWLRRRITAYRETDESHSGLVLTYVDITEQVRLRLQSVEHAEQATLRDVALSLPQLLWRLDVQGRLDWLSPQYEVFTGVAASVVVADQQAFMDRLHPEDLAAALPVRETALARGEPFHLRYRILGRNGAYRWFEAHTLPLRDAAGGLRGWLGTANDVHDLVQTQQKLEASEQFVRLVADNVSGMVGYWDRRYVNQFANAQYQIWFGKTPDQVVGRTAEELMGAELWAKNKPLFDAALAGEPQTFERAVPGPDGVIRHSLAHYVPHVVGGVVRGMVATVNDVTPLYQARRSFETLLDTLPIAILVVGPDGRILRGNEEATQLVGVDAEALARMTVEDLVPEAQRRKHLNLRKGYSQAPSPRQMGNFSSQRFELLRADGTTTAVDVALAPCVWEGQKAVVALVRDLRRFEVMAQQEANRADIARGTFLATMSHEIRTPLNAIMGLSQLLVLEQPTPRQRDRLQGIEDASRHLLGVVNDVLDLAQIESGQLRQDHQPFSVKTMLEKSMALVESTARIKHLELTHAIDAAVPIAVVGDERRVEQILVNLLSNAVKFTPSGGVHVKVGAKAVEGKSLAMHFEVRDTGIGIAAEQLPQLFKPFSQADQGSSRRFGGTGLGLAISRHLARAMGGDCGVRSELGVGSQFWFSVQVARAEPSRMPHLDTGGEGVSLSLPSLPELAGSRLLVVEDDRVNQVVLLELLRKLGAQHVDVAETGLEAIDKAREGYDLILMDMQLPGMDGVTATRHILDLRLQKRPAIIALTANVMLEDVARCLEAGMDSHLAKPVNLEQLASTLKRWLRVKAEPSGGA